MNQREVWNKIAKQWSLFRKKTPNEVETFLKNKEGKLLDLGCGSGRNMVLNKNLEYYGVDFSKEMLILSEKKAGKNKIKSSFREIDIGKENLPFEDDYFNFFIFLSTLHCIETEEHREKSLKELFRVMKKGAIGMLSVWKKEEILKQWEKEKVEDLDISTAKEIFVNWKNNNKIYQRYYYFYEKNELKSLLKKIGFKILTIPQKWKSQKHFKKNIIFYLEK
jgi:ubiquinone/menaquinone biosynthesis C-methylase UbiE